MPIPSAAAPAKMKSLAVCWFTPPAAINGNCAPASSDQFAESERAEISDVTRVIYALMDDDAEFLKIRALFSDS